MTLIKASVDFQDTTCHMKIVALVPILLKKKNPLHFHLLERTLVDCHLEFEKRSSFRVKSNVIY
jgi:hypothetical protein